VRGAAVALALFGAAATLGALECAARLALPPPRHHAGLALVFHPELGFRGEPGARIEAADAAGRFEVALDAQGFRRREPAPPGVPGAREIALLGDSFAVAQGVRDADTLSSRLEAELAARGVAARVRDLAVVDYGTAQQLLLWRALGAGLAPDTVVLALYPANDWPNNTPALAGRTTVSPGDYVRPYLVPGAAGALERRFAHPVRAALRRVSHAFAALEPRVLAWGAAERVGWLAPWPAPQPVPARLRDGRAPREELELFREPAPGSAWDEAWRTSEALLRALRDEVRARGARFVVLGIPSLLQVEAEATAVRLELQARRHAGRGLAELCDWNLPERRLAAFFAKEQIEALLLLDAFREAAQSGASLYLSDGHFSPRGHALAASRLAQALADGAPLRAPAPASGGPTPRLPAPDAAPAWLDFRAEAHEDWLVRGGWLAWLRGAGWLPSARASLVLPARAGDLVLRGTLPAHAARPVGVRLRLRDAETRARVEAPGAFEVRLPAPLARDAPRFVEVELELAASARPGQAAELHITSAGFEPSASQRRPGAS
jgi:hypothetical protein